MTLETTFPPPEPARDADAAVVAGTLCLMSSFAQHAHPRYAARIADNLALLAASAAASAEFRTVCGRLAQRWRELRDDAERACRLSSPHDRRSLQ